MAKITENSKKIKLLLKKGYKKTEIVKKGFSASTVRYWDRQMFHPEIFKKMVDKIKSYQSQKYATKKLNSYNKRNA